MTNETQNQLEKPTRQHRGHKIILQNNWQFTVEGPEFENERYTINFKSLEAAIEEINKRSDVSAAIEARNLKISERVIGEDGKVYNIDRIDRRTCNLRGVPETTKYVYPNTLWISLALNEIVKLRTRIKEIDEQLYKVRISNSRGFGSIDADDYARKLEALKKDISEAAIVANEMSKPQVIEGETKEGKEAS